MTGLRCILLYIKNNLDLLTNFEEITIGYGGSLFPFVVQAGVIISVCLPRSGKHFKLNKMA